MIELYPWIAPDGVEVLTTWLAPLAECRTQRPTGAVLPFIMVRRIGGGDDGLTDIGRYHVSVFRGESGAAGELAVTVHRRVRLLAGPQTVTVRGRSVYADDVRTVESFRPEPYGAEPEIARWRAVYELRLRCIAAV